MPFGYGVHGDNSHRTYVILDVGKNPRVPRGCFIAFVFLR